MPLTFLIGPMMRDHPSELWGQGGHL